MLDLLTWLTDVLRGTVGSPWLWVAVFLISGLDALVPFSPSETTVITVAVLLGPDLGQLALLTVVATVGALAGDCASYAIARGAGPVALRRMQRGERGRQRYLWARTKVHQHAPVLILGARYLPGGRMATALATGSMRYPAARFVTLDAIGASVWAAYSVLIGWVGGAAFAHEPAKGLLLAFALGLATVGTIAAVRSIRSRRAVLRLRTSDERAQRGAADGGEGGRSGGAGADVPGVDDAAPGPASREGAVLGQCDDRRPERPSR